MSPRDIESLSATTTPRISDTGESLNACSQTYSTFRCFRIRRNRRHRPKHQNRGDLPNHSGQWDSTVTVVFRIGAHSWQTKICGLGNRLQLRQTKHSSRSGLLGIILPTISKTAR